MTKDEAKVLLEELEYKKQYKASFDGTCACCGDDIHIGDTFVFMGEKKKVCIGCLADMQDEMETFT